MRIAWFSPLCSTAILRSSCLSIYTIPRLIEHCEVEIFTSESALNMNCSLGCPIFHVHRFVERHDASSFDFIICHLEDNAAVQLFESPAQVWPGVCFLHDTNFNKLNLSHFKHSTAGSDIASFFESEFGSNIPAIGDWKIRGWSIECFDRLLPSGKHLRNAGALRLVPSIENARDLPDSETVHVLPFPIAYLPNVHEIASSNRELRFGFFGIEKLAGRLLTIIQTLNRLADEGTPFAARWIVASDNEISVAENLLLDVSPQFRDLIEILAVQEIEELAAFMSSCSVWIAPSFHPGRALPISTLLAVRLGIPLIGSNSLEWGELPKPAYIGIDIGCSEQAQLYAVLRSFIENPKLLKEQSAKMQKVLTALCGFNFIDTFFALLEKHKISLETILNQYKRVYTSLQQGLASSAGGSLDPQRILVAEEFKSNLK